MLCQWWVELLDFVVKLAILLAKTVWSASAAHPSGLRTSAVSL
jgi:hypothetical protein